MNRRNFNRTLFTLAGVAAMRRRGCAAEPAQASQPSPAVVDTHAHIFRRGLQLAANPRYVPDYDATLTALLENVKADEAARQQFVDILELMGPTDPRTAAYRKKLTARLY